MRIVHFNNYADLVGGAEIYAHGLVRALRERGHEVTFFGTSPEREVDEPGLRVVRRPAHDKTRLIRDTAVLASWRELIQRVRPQLIHAHNFSSVALDVVHEVGSTEIPLVQTVHDFHLLCPNSWCVRGDGSPCFGGAGAQCFEHGCQRNGPYDPWSVLLTSLRQRIAAGNACIALAPSTYMAERLRAHGWEDVRHLPYFIDFPSAPVCKRSSLELLFVGRLEREKGLNVLIDAMPTIVSTIPGAHLTVIGDGSQARSLRSQVHRRGLGSVIQFSPKIPHTELATKYSSAAACVLPSLWSENSPLVAYECLQSGLPLIGSRAGGIPEIITPDCGLTFIAGDPQDLANTAIRFMRLPPEERERMSLSARAHALKHDKARHLSLLENIYGNALEAAPRLQRLGVWGDSDFLTILTQIEAQIAARPMFPTPLQVVRSIARRLGLPKVLPG